MNGILAAMVEPLPAEGGTDGYIVETERKLSESVIWRLQRNFYAIQGQEAWTGGKVPCRATSNPLIAGIYADIVMSYLRDLRATFDGTAPIYIVELGGGSGAFGYLFLKKLQELKRASSLHALDVRYVMTDFAVS